MLSSENKYHVTISFNQNIEGIFLTLVDGTLETVYTGTAQQLSLELPEGIYKLRAKFIDYTQEYPLIIDESRDIRLDFDYPSVAPILSFKTTHEYFHDNSEYYSQVSTNQSIQDKPNFLFFAAKYDKDKFHNVIMEKLLPNYSVINSSNEILHQFGSENTMLSNEYGWLAFSTKLPNGQYFLKWNGESECRIFPFYIFDNYQTQFFIRYSTLPDFENCFFFYTKKMCFRFDSEEYLVLDKILFAYKDYSNYKLLTEKDKFIIQQHPYLVTLIHILQSELTEKLDYENLEHVPLPDLLLLLDNRNQIENDELLPVISSVMNKYTYNTENKKLSFKPASLVDRTIDHVRYDLFWNNFSKIDNTVDWLDLYSKYVNKSDLFPVSSSDNQIVRLSKRVANTFSKASKDTIQIRLNSLIGKLDIENFEVKINDTINSIGDVSEIADKLNLPPTKVLRNYETYKGIYDKLK
jgi:hypothetical protein